LFWIFYIEGEYQGKENAMKLAMLIMTLVLAAIMLTGCLYSHVTLPYGTELNKTELGHKKGTACLYSVLWLFAWGDAGAAAASKNGGITTLTHMDRETYSLLFGIYTRHTTIVYGD
jgi:hypothetical protein